MEPKAAVQQLTREHSREWVREFAEYLSNEVLNDDFTQALRVARLNDTDAARIFGVTRQAIAKWRSEQVPAERLTEVLSFTDAINLLLRYVKAERLPAVVRRHDAAGRSLLDIAAAESCETMKLAAMNAVDLRRVAS